MVGGSFEEVWLGCIYSIAKGNTTWNRLVRGVKWFKGTQYFWYHTHTHTPAHSHTHGKREARSWPTFALIFFVRPKEGNAIFPAPYARFSSPFSTVFRSYFVALPPNVWWFWRPSMGFTFNRSAIHLKLVLLHSAREQTNRSEPENGNGIRVQQTRPTRATDSQQQR